MYNICVIQHPIYHTATMITPLIEMNFATLGFQFNRCREWEISILLQFNIHWSPLISTILQIWKRTPYRWPQISRLTIFSNSVLLIFNMASAATGFSTDFYSSLFSQISAAIFFVLHNEFQIFLMLLKFCISWIASVVDMRKSFSLINCVMNTPNYFSSVHRPSSIGVF